MDRNILFDKWNGILSFIYALTHTPLHCSLGWR